MLKDCDVKNILFILVISVSIKAEKKLIPLRETNFCKATIDLDKKLLIRGNIRRT